MNSPARVTEHFSTPVSPRPLGNRLLRTQEATPGISFESDIEQDYQWLCEQLYQSFKPHEVDNLRGRIRTATYWEIETRMLYDAVTQRFDGAKSWRKAAAMLRRLLRENGLSAHQVN